MKIANLLRRLNWRIGFAIRKLREKIVPGTCVGSCTLYSYDTEGNKAHFYMDEKHLRIDSRDFFTNIPAGGLKLTVFAEGRN